LARVYSALQQFDAAADELQALLTRQPARVDALTELGLAERGRENLDGALEWLERAKALDPDDGAVHRHVGTVLREQGDTNAALVALTRATELDAENADAYHELAFVLGELGRHDDARSATRRAIDISPSLGGPQAHLTLEPPEEDEKRRSAAMEAVQEPTAALAHYNLGLAFRRQGSHNEALREFRLALDSGDDRRMVLPAIAELHLLKRDHAAALEAYERIVEEIGGKAKLWNERGVVLHQLGRFEDAVASYRRALMLDPRHVYAMNNLAVTLAYASEPTQAVSVIGDAIRAAPDDRLPQVNLGLMLLKLRRFELAMEAFRRVLEGDRDNPVAWNGIGLVLTELGRHSDARNAFASAVDASPDSAEAHYNLSFALSRLGEYDEALREVTRAQTLDPYYVPGRLHLGIDLMREDPSVAVVPEISTDVASGLGGQGFTFDPELLDDLFQQLDSEPESAAERGLDPFAAARTSLKRGQLITASDQVQRALRNGADPVEANALLGEVFAQRGLHGEALERFRTARASAPQRLDLRLGEMRQLLALRRATAALGEAVALSAAHPDDVDVLSILAQARLATGDSVKAATALQLARASAPDRADLLKLEGDIALAQGELHSARESFRSAVDQEPRFLEAWLALGGVYEETEDWAEAESAYRSALEVDAGFAPGTLALAGLYRKRGSPSVAVNMLADLLAGHPANLDALVSLGRALLDDGRPAQALEAFERLLQYDEDHVGALFLSAVADARLRRFREAVACWERVVALDPDGPLAARARELASTALDLQRLFPAEEN
jgi:tetratricopeptide (TPR) repeat protein